MTRLVSSIEMASIFLSEFQFFVKIELVFDVLFSMCSFQGASAVSSAIRT